MAHPQIKLYIRALTADGAWMNALEAQFGRDALKARYSADGRGAPGSDLRALYEAKLAADRDWLACQRQTRGQLHFAEA